MFRAYGFSQIVIPHTPHRLQCMLLHQYKSNLWKSPLDKRIVVFLVDV